MSSEYGWTDEQIGELPLARFRQITAAIQIRKYNQARQENARFSWLARNLAGFIAAGYWVEKGKENKALKQASKIAYDDIEAMLLGADVARPTSGDPMQRADPEKVAEQNGAGSFERFAMMTGQLAQRGKML